MRAIYSLVVVVAARAAAAEIRAVVVVMLVAAVADILAAGILVEVVALLTSAAVEEALLTSVVVVVVVRPTLEVEVFLTLAGAGECMRRPVQEVQPGSREMGGPRTSIVHHHSVSQMSADSRARHVRSNPQTIWEREHNRERVRVREEFSQGASEPATLNPADRSEGTADSPGPRINPA